MIEVIASLPNRDGNDGASQCLAGLRLRHSSQILHARPAVQTGIAHMDRQNLLNAAKLAPVIRRHPRVQLIAAGHVHRATLTMFAGVPTTICPAPNHAVDLDLAQLREPSFKVEPRAFHVHAWFPGQGFGRVVTHQVPIGDFDGPHPFFGKDGRLL
jgi:Icc protein